LSQVLSVAFTHWSAAPQSGSALHALPSALGVPASGGALLPPEPPTPLPPMPEPPDPVVPVAVVVLGDPLVELVVIEVVLPVAVVLGAPPAPVRPPSSDPEWLGAFVQALAQKK